MTSSDSDDWDRLTRESIRQHKSQNIVDRLRWRETLGIRCNVNPYFVTRPFHQSVLPNLTVCDIEKPACFLRKFTPDGRYMIAFSGDQTSVEIYQYNGPAAANELLQNVQSNVEYTTRLNTPNLANIRQQIFGRLFSLKHSISVVTNGEQLNRECSLFVNCLQLTGLTSTMTNHKSTPNASSSSNPPPSSSMYSSSSDSASSSSSSVERSQTKGRSPTYRVNKQRPLIQEHQYLIVGSAQNFAEDNYPHYCDIYSNNESISLSARLMLEDYTLYLIDIEHGRMTDKRTFKVDKIFLSHNQGVYLYRNTLAVLSIQHQTIHLFEIDFTENGAIFVEMRKIGRFCYEDDEFLINSAYLSHASPSCTQSRSNANQSSSSGQAPVRRTTLRPFSYAKSPGSPLIPAFREKPINALKHRIAVFLYRRALQQQQQNPEGNHLKQFNERFDLLLNLRMWKMQLLDQSHLLIKYTHEEVITLRISDMHSLPTLLVIYNFKSTKVVDVFQSPDSRLLHVYERFCDHFRNVNNTHRVYGHFETLLHLTDEHREQNASTSSSDSDHHSDYSRFYIDHSFQFVSSSANNHESAEFHRKSKQALSRLCHRAEQEVTKRILSQIPVSAQSYNCSPYLDFSLFSYEEKWISPLERPKQCENMPIRFYDRSSASLAFRLFAGIPNNWDYDAVGNRRLLAAFTFHPHDPFIISIQRVHQEYVVNLHLRHCSQL